MRLDLAAPRSEETPVVETEKAKILLVDDSKTMRNIQKGILAQLGHTDVTEAVDGLDGDSQCLRGLRL